MRETGTENVWRADWKPGVRNMKKAIFTTIFMVGVLVALAQYSIDWYTIDGGGGTSTGGVYTVSGTIGQPDAGRMSGGPYSLEGGFWGIVNIVQTPGAPLLTITSSGGGVVLSWPAPSTGWVLQQNPDLATTNAWANVPGSPVVVGTNNTVTVAPALGNRFYRLAK